MKSKRLIIYGDSSFSEMITHYFQKDSVYEVVAFCVDREYRTRDEIDGCKVYALDEIEEYFSAENHEIFAAIGYKSVRTHRDLFEKIEKLAYPVASYISSDAVVDESCQIGVNTLILPGTVIEPHAVVEKNCFVNSSVVVCHHSRIKAHTILAAGSVIGGHTEIGESSLIGFNATVAELLQVADETLVAAGSVLLQDTQRCTMYAGVPAKPLRTYEETGIILQPTKHQKG